MQTIKDSHSGCGRL